jgi:hypothetical protein
MSTVVNDGFSNMASAAPTAIASNLTRGVVFAVVVFANPFEKHDDTKTSMSINNLE